MEKEFKTEIIAPEIEPKYRHPFILESFDKLSPGEYLCLQNDHDHTAPISIYARTNRPVFLGIFRARARYMACGYRQGISRL